MKRRFFRASWMLALAGMVAFAFVGTSCGDDDDDPAPAPTPSNNNGNNNGNNSGENGNGNGNGNGNDKENEDDGIQNHVIVVETQKMVSHEWDTQFWFGSDTEFKGGDEWEVSFDYKADASTLADIPTQIHKGAGNYVFYEAIGSIAFTTKWQTFTAKGTFRDDEFDGKEADLVDGSGKFIKDAGTCIAFNLNQHNPANKYYFDNISFKINGEDVIVNGDLEDKTAGYSCFWIKECPAGETDKNKIDKNQPVEVTKDNLCEKPADTEEALTEEDKAGYFIPSKTITWKNRWAGPTITVEEDWVSVTVEFEEKPANVQFCVTGDVSGDGSATYPPLEEEKGGTVDLAAVLTTIQGQLSETTKIAKITLQATREYTSEDGEEGNGPYAEPIVAKLKSVTATLKDGSKKLVKKIAGDWGSTVTVDE